MSEKVKIVSPRGILMYVTIDGEGKEDLNGDMKYQASVVIDADNPFLKTIEKFWNQNKPASFNKPAQTLGYKVFKAPTDKKYENGKTIYEEDPSKVSITFKTRTTFPDGTAKKIRVRNAKNNPVTLPSSVKVSNGSIGHLAGMMSIYETKAKNGALIDAGVTFYLNAIQIIKLVEYNADDGFSTATDEDGWTGEDTTFEEEYTQEPSEPVQAATNSRPRL